MSERPSRRGLLGTLAAVPAFAAFPAFSEANGDAEILALAVQIDAIEAEQADIDAQIEPHEAERNAIQSRYPGYGSPHASVNDPPTPRYIRWREELDAFDAERGLDSLYGRQDPLCDRAFELTNRMWAIPAKTQAGRQAKAKRLLQLADCKNEPWRGAEEDLDYHIAMARKLIGELAGLDETALAAI
jgi:hypothetical protein